MTKQHRLPQEKYAELAGEEWPSYHDYLAGKIPRRFQIEISTFEAESRKHLIDAVSKQNAKSATLKSPGFLIRVFLSVLLPAVVGTGLYFYLGGTLTKFFILFLCFRFLNIMYSLVIHRWLCHHMFEPKPWARPILLWIIVAGSWVNPGNWIRSHWAHHVDGDTELDPYPPTWGFLNLCLIGSRGYIKYPFNRWLVATDIKFVLRNILWLCILNAAFFAFIDFDIFLLSFLFIQLYAWIETGASNYLLHDGFHTKMPINYPVFGYFVSLFVAIESVHAVHTSNPWVFNQAKNVDGAIDIGYWLMRPFAATERE